MPVIFICLKTIFDVLGEVQHLGSAIFAGESRPALVNGHVRYRGTGGSDSGVRTVCSDDTKGKLV